MNQVGSGSTPSTAGSNDAATPAFWGVRYHVSDVDRAVDFYTEALGFSLVHRHGPAIAQVSLGGVELLLSGPGSSGSRPMPDGTRQEPGGWNRIVIRVDDLPAAIDELQRGGHRFRNAMETRSRLRTRTATPSSCSSPPPPRSDPRSRRRAGSCGDRGTNSPAPH